MQILSGFSTIVRRVCIPAADSPAARNLVAPLAQQAEFAERALNAGRVGETLERQVPLLRLAGLDDDPP
jgi:hypothetical protein